MKFRLLVVAVTIAVSGATAASAQSKTGGGLGDAQLREANSREVAAFLATDAAGLARLWSDDFVVTNPLNKVATKPQVLAMVKGGTLSFKSYDRRIEQILHHGDMAIVIGSENVEWSGKMPLAGKLLPLRYTAIWRETGGKWQEVARHASVVTAP